MSKKLFLPVCVSLMSVGFLFSCSTNPNKVEKGESKLERVEDVGSNRVVGVNDKGEVVTKKKQALVDQLRDIQQEVYDLEIEIYGSEKLGRDGHYGALQKCLDKNKELKRLPEKNILTKSEDQFNGKMVIDNKDKLVSIDEEFYLDRTKRFMGYRDSYELQKADYQEKLRICKHQEKNAGT